MNSGSKVYEIVFKPSVAKQLRKLPKGEQRKIVEKVKGLSTDPRPHGVKKLQGKTSLYRLSAGDYRIIYTIEDDKLKILILRVGDRKDIYRILGRLEK